MKKRFFLLLAPAFFGTAVPAQDTTGGMHRISETSEHTDRLSGKQIQQQSLKSPGMQMLGTRSPVAAVKPKKRTAIKKNNKCG